VGKFITALVARDLLEDGALIVYEHATGGSGRWPHDIARIATKRYGSTEIEIACYEKGAGST
jgi:16S rRNA G966 N2-methylase RsmD